MLIVFQVILEFRKELLVVININLGHNNEKTS